MEAHIIVKDEMLQLLLTSVIIGNMIIFDNLNKDEKIRKAYFIQIAKIRESLPQNILILIKRNKNKQFFKIYALKRKLI